VTIAGEEVGCFTGVEDVVGDGVGAKVGSKH